MDVFAVLNQSKVLWGVSMLLLNFGARYVMSDLGKIHELLLSSEIMKKLVVLSMFFVATRDLLTSFLLTVAYIIIIDGMLHERRKICILPNTFVTQTDGNATKQSNRFDFSNYMANIAFVRAS
jgi:hypothetical protein